MKYSRKSFLKSLGLSGLPMLFSCRRPVERIIPAVERAPETIPGIAAHYASTAPDGSGIIVKTREGRPIKIAGNPAHPLNGRGITAATAAATSDLYDPDRLRHPLLRYDAGSRNNGKKNGGPQLHGGRQLPGGRHLPGPATPNGDRPLRRVSEHRILNEVRNRLKKGRFALITPPLQGPGSRDLVRRFLKLHPAGDHFQFDPDDTALRLKEGQDLCYGRGEIPAYRLERAGLIVSLDADFLGTMLFPAYFAAGFGRFRDVRRPGGPGRLISFESNFSLTGANADERHPIRPGDSSLIALALAAEIIVRRRTGNIHRERGVIEILTPFLPENISSGPGHREVPFPEKKFVSLIRRTATELIKHRGRGLIVAGSPLDRNGGALELQITVNLLNSALDNEGRTIDGRQPLQIETGESIGKLAALFAELKGGRYDTVIMAGINPVYHLPPAWKTAEILGRIDYLLAIADRLDETSSLARAVLPLSHFLESWNDRETMTGIYSLQQPVIRPLMQSASLEDYLIRLAGGNIDGATSHYRFLRRRWAALKKGHGVPDPFDHFWNSALRLGYFATGPGKQSRPRHFQIKALDRLRNQSPRAKKKPEANTLKLGLYYSARLHTGEQANNPRLQELPDPVLKTSWGNVLSLLPDTARRLGLRQGSLVRIVRGERSLELPVHLQPGLHPDACVAALGFGRTKAGRVGDGIGRNPLTLAENITGESGRIVGLRLSGLDVRLEDTGRLAGAAVEQRVYDEGRNHIDGRSGGGALPFGPSGEGGRPERRSLREITLADFSRPDFQLPVEAKRRAAIPSHNDPGTDGDPSAGPETSGPRWQMLIDLSLCIGCGSCVVSCSVENNIPTVGPREAARGRTMQWLRIDRYYDGAEENPHAGFQPMLCQQCDRAPCESVCPVAATTHNSEGLNTMTYNRCIGSRYCSNNCPYRVRRFNWFDNWRQLDGLDRVIDSGSLLLGRGLTRRNVLRSPRRLELNPDVTVRNRGVMEKCTFCIQRLAAARRDMKVSGARRIRDGAAVTACQEVCPTEAIVFGDGNDPQSLISRRLKDQHNTVRRAYRVLDFLDVRPSITYLARVRNQPEDSAE